ncbi:MAG: hypothetical protein IKU28_09580, partial [Erysipelotrichaceae bacterium]|nr:hypothetical protein [Erysipelotrichaceae bacterium]
YGAEGGYAYLADVSDLSRNGADSSQDAVNAYVIDRQEKTIQVVRIGASEGNFEGTREEMTIPYYVPFVETEYLFDTTGLVKVDLSNVEWVNYGIQADGVNPTYNPNVRYSTNAIFDVPYPGVTFYIKINAPYELGIRSGATDTTMNTNYYWLNNKEVTNTNQHRGYVYQLPENHKKFIISFANITRNGLNSSYLSNNDINELELRLADVEIWYEPLTEQMTMQYDDHLDMTGKTVQILDAGTNNVVTLEGNYLVATGIGDALVLIDGIKYEIAVEKAQVNLVVIMGQSNAGNHFDNATSEVTSPLGTAYWWGNGKGTSATEPVDYTQASKGFHTPLIAELYAQSVESGNPVKPVMIWQEGITSKNGKSITSWATSASNASGTKDTATMITNCLNYYEQNSDKYEVVSTGVYWLQGESDINMNPVLYTERFMAMWNTLKTAGADYLAFLRVRKSTNTQGVGHEDLGHHAALSAQIAMANQYVDMFMATDLTENWTGTAEKTHSVDLRNYITLMQLYGADGQYTDTYGNNATVSNGILTTTMKTLYGSNNQCHYGKFGYGLIGADAAYNMTSSLSTLKWSIVQTDTSGKAERKVISEAGDVNVIDITEMSDHLSFRASCGSAAGTLSIKVTSDGKDITNSEGIIIKEGSYYGAVNVEALKKYTDVSITVTYTLLNGKAGSVDYCIEYNVMTMQYDDHLDMTGKTVQIIDAGT